MAGPDGQLLHVAWVSRRVCVCVCGGAGHSTSSGRTGLGRSREAGARWPQLYCGGFDVNKDSDFCRDSTTDNAREYARDYSVGKMLKPTLEAAERDAKRSARESDLTA